MVEELNLTPQELEIIRLKREQDELASKQKLIDKITKVQNDKITQEQKEQKALDDNIKKLQELYPDANVESNLSGERDYNGKWVTFKKITIIFPNKISIEYKVYGDGYLGRKSINFGKIGNWELMEHLSKIQQNEIL